MSDIATPAQRPTVKPGDVFEMPCANPQCAKKMQLEIPRIETINQRSFSSYHFSHETVQTCEHCGLSYLFCLLPWGQGFTFRPVQVEKESRIITAQGNAWTDQQLKNKEN